jgi:NAD(P)-dependent dehydrogenase (short-subunit alcohol dehydrogenase family)
MNVDGKVAIVTGGAGGIGAALARSLGAAGARVVVADLDGEGAERVASSIGDRSAAIGVRSDVASPDGLAELIRVTEDAHGPVDIFCANAGIAGESGLPADSAWDEAIQINLMAHVRAARLLLPGWVERGQGYFVTTASAAGLLTEMGMAPYTATKHAAVGFAEWLAVTHGDRGVRVSCLCPMAVNTRMLTEGLDDADSDAAAGARATVASGDVLEPEIVAEHVLAAIADETFLILPHPEVLTYFRRKADDHERWLRGMRRLHAASSARR